MRGRSPTSSRSRLFAEMAAAQGANVQYMSGWSSRANGPPSPLDKTASATALSAIRLGEQPSRSRARKIARKMSASDIDAATEVNLSASAGVHLAEPRPTQPLPPAHAAAHVAGAPVALCA